MNKVTIHYAYATSDMADKLKAKDGCFYVMVGTLNINQAFKTIHGAEGFCNNNGLNWEEHRFPKK